MRRTRRYARRKAGSRLLDLSAPHVNHVSRKELGEKLDINEHVLYIRAMINAFYEAFVDRIPLLQNFMFDNCEADYTDLVSPTDITTNPNEDRIIFINPALSNYEIWIREEATGLIYVLTHVAKAENGDVLSQHVLAEYPYLGDAVLELIKQTFSPLSYDAALDTLREYLE